MPRPMLYPDIMPARLPAGTLARARASCRDKETVADLIRAAVEAELQRRENGQGLGKPPKSAHGATVHVRSGGITNRS